MHSMKKIIVIIGGILLVGIAYYGISPLFNNTMVNDELPGGVGVESETTANTESGGTQEAPSASGTTSTGSNEVAAEGSTEVSSNEEEAQSGGTNEMQDSGTTQAPPQETSPAMERQGPFTVMGTFGHPAEGTLSVLTIEGKQYLRFEDFKTINGPRLHLYLSKDKDGSDFIDLGPIRGTEGNINYEIPEGVNIEDYPFVLHWCVPFRVLFNYAEVK